MPYADRIKTPCATCGHLGDDHYAFAGELGHCLHRVDIVLEGEAAVQARNDLDLFLRNGTPVRVDGAVVDVVRADRALTADGRYQMTLATHCQCAMWTEPVGVIATGATVIVVGLSCYAGTIGRAVATFDDPGTVMVEMADPAAPLNRVMVLPFGRSELMVAPIAARP
jgi:hypothetical protein